MTALVHDRLDDGDAFDLLHREFIDSLDKLVLGNVTEAVLTVLAKPAVLSEDSRVCKTLQYTVSETSISHVVEAWQNVHFLKLSLVCQFAWTRSRTRANETQVPLQLITTLTILVLV